jgi:hypothetical protein
MLQEVFLHQEVFLQEVFLHVLLPEEGRLQRWRLPATWKCYVGALTKNKF